MEIPKAVTNLANNIVQRVKDYQKPKEIATFDEQRLEREIAYAKRIRKVNPHLKASNNRRKQIQERRRKGQLPHSQGGA
jgi:hypothetical protein